MRLIKVRVLEMPREMTGQLKCQEDGHRATTRGAAFTVVIHSWETREPLSVLTVLMRCQAMTEFFMDMIPPKTTAQMKGISNGRIHVKPEVMEAKRVLLAGLVKFRPESPTESILSVYVEYVFPWFKKDAKTALKRSAIFHSGKPDVDNMVKLLFDCMTQLGFWKDDSQIVMMTAAKYRGERTGIGIIIKDIDEGEA